MKTSSAKDKGRELEKWVVQRLKEKGLDDRAIRTPGSGNGLDKGDVANNLGWNIECKNWKVPDISTWMKQSLKDAGLHQKPLIVWHPAKVPLGNSLAILYAEDFLDLVIKSRMPKDFGNQRELSYKFRRLITDLKSILKELEI